MSLFVDEEKPFEDFNYIVEKYKLTTEFSKKSLAELEKYPDVIKDGIDYQDRVDLRNELIITIDGEDAKDFDDAISLKKKEKGWQLGVHIADVSYYVKKNSSLDKDAFKRGNSFYLINKVIPMLPEKLSNDLCSLKPNCDRLTLSVNIDMDENGKIKSYRFFNSVIHSKYRLTYNYVQDYFDGKIDISDENLKKMLNDMRELCHILYKRRIENGGLDFDFSEIKCVLDNNDNPIKIFLKPRLESERLIEEFMLSANRCAAKYLSKKGYSIYRVHEDPSIEKINNFLKLISKFNLKKIKRKNVKNNDVDVKLLQDILKQAKDKNFKEFINIMLLRTMQQARYEVENVGHFGLGFEYYTHFTSPIRRYSDLIIHRLIKHYLNNGEKDKVYSKAQLEKISEHVSKQERIAVDCEREILKIKSARFMKDKVNNEYPAIITGITTFGIFASIEENGIEGLIRFEKMEDDYYIFDEKDYIAIGKRTKKKYMIGDKIKIKVYSVNVEKQFIDFLIVDDDANNNKIKIKNNKVKKEKGLKKKRKKK